MRPAVAAALGIALTIAVPWLASLVGIFSALRASPRTGAFLLVADLVGVPLLVVFWTHATVSRELRLSSTGDAAAGSSERYVLSYYVPGRGGGAWLSVVRPRLLLRTKSVLLVATRSGPRLLPRFVRRDGAAPEELAITEGAVMLVEVGGAARARR